MPKEVHHLNGAGEGWALIALVTICVVFLVGWYFVSYKPWTKRLDERVLKPGERIGPPNPFPGEENDGS